MSRIWPPDPAADDDTVVLPRPLPAGAPPGRDVPAGTARAPRRRRVPVMIGLTACAAAILLLAWSALRHDAPQIRIASERAILLHQAETLTVFRWDRDPAVLVLDFPDLASQGAMLNRIAAFAEKAGLPHDRVLDDAELAAAIRAAGDTPSTFYYGHDYDDAEITGFFRAADRDGVRLDPAEQWLRRLLHDQGRTAHTGSTPDVPGDVQRVALISLPRVAPPVDQHMRAIILHHELAHGVFFTLPDYAAWSERFWSEDLSPSERAGFRSWLAREGYDPLIERTMLNEAQAYLVWTPDRRFFEPALAGLQPDRADTLRRLFLAGIPADARREDVAVPAP